MPLQSWCAGSSWALTEMQVQREGEMRASISQQGAPGGAVPAMLPRGRAVGGR